MPLQPGQTLAHYRIDRKLGEGGMGEVWAATDTRLNRTAAIKSLPPAVAADGERLARFNREAQLLAALNHQNIAAIFGLEKDDDGAPYLAMELVDGDDLTVRIEDRPIPHDEAIEIALQIAAALEEAHDKGIIHRDLKPANIKLTDDGKVKVLDFGLAKALCEDPDDSGSSLDFSTSPTLTAAMGTQAGIILGTAGYMSPEQARGKKVDRRTDIWAFGVVLFEMLTGERLYHGETVTDVIAAVVTREPEWEKLPTSTPASLRRVLKRCLQKDPRKRLRDIGDAALELREPSVDEPTADEPPPASANRGWLLGAAGLVLGALLTYVVLSTGGAGKTTASPLWTNLEPPAGTTFYRFLELSPDGKMVVFVALSEPDGDRDNQILWLRNLDDERARPLPGTEGANQPFWSPDSKSIGFFSRRKLRRIEVDGGVTQAMANAGNDPRGGSWGADGTILYVPDWSEPVYRVAASGGESQLVTTLNAERLEISHRWPHLLPDGKHFVYFVVSTYPEVNPDNPSETDQSGLYIASLDGGESTLLQKARSRAVYSRDALVYVDDGILMSRPFDLKNLSFNGNAVAIASDVNQTVGALWGAALFSVADNNTLMFVRGAPEAREISQLMWVNRKGEIVERVGKPQSIVSMKLSSSGKFAAVAVGDPEDVWIYDLERNNSTRFTFDVGTDGSPLWSPDDETILFNSIRVIPGENFMPVRLYRKETSGLEAEEFVVAADAYGPTLIPTDWSPDGKTVIATATRPGTGNDLLTFSMETLEFEVFLETEDTEQAGTFSPSGRWVAYESDVSGTLEVYVRAFPGPGGEWQVSTNGGMRPIWREDGSELFYVSNDGQMMSVAVESAEAFRHDTPVEMFKMEGSILPDGSSGYGVQPDGSKFLIMGPVEGEAPQSAVISLVKGWR
ncbi:MAG: protein kinase [Acidobacteriota bacterium]|nr:protein kinase [Acidobacteriota bacterium]MDH3785379.1 protein kinase [Acidobacteriota bacterium]